MSEIAELFKGCDFYTGDYGEYASHLAGYQLVGDNIPKVSQMRVKVANKIKSLGHTLDYFPNLHTLIIEKANKVTDFDYIRHLYNLKELRVRETSAQENWAFLESTSLEKATVYDEANISISILPKSLKELALYGSFDFSPLSGFEGLEELVIDNSAGNPLLAEKKNLQDNYELPLLPSSLKRLVIRGSCELKDNDFLGKLSDDCKIYMPDKGCENLSIPDRFSNASR